MANFERKDPSCIGKDGEPKAPEHRKAALKAERKGAINEPIDTESTQMLVKTESWFNPYHININGKYYQLKDIIIYKPNGDSIRTHRGWFGSNNNMNEFPIPAAVKRLKPKYDGSTFIVPKKKEWHERHDEYPHAVLYIPYSYFDFERKVVDHNWVEGTVKHVPTHISRRFKQDSHGTPLTVEENDKSTETISKKATELKENIADLEAKLADAKKKLGAM